jgi:hypothetical protein
MTDKLTQAARCGLAELFWQYYEGGLPDAAKRTIIELHDSLKEAGEDLLDYEDDYRNVVEDMTEKSRR